MKADKLAESRSLPAKQMEIMLLNAEFQIQNKAFRKAENLLHRIKQTMEKPGNYAGLYNYPDFVKTSARLYSSWYQANSDPSFLRNGLRILEAFHRQNLPAAKVYALLRDRGYSGKNDKAIWELTILFTSKLFEVTGDKTYFEKAVSYAEAFSAAIFTEESKLAREAATGVVPGKDQVTEAQLRLEINKLIAGSAEPGMTAEEERSLIGLVNQLENLCLTKERARQQDQDFLRENLVERLQQKLNNKESYLKIFETEEELLQFLITRGKVYFRRIEKSMEFNQACGLFTRFVSTPGSRTTTAEVTAYAQAAHLLYQQLIQPLEAGIEAGDLILEWPDSGNRLVLEPLLTSPVQVFSPDMHHFPFYFLKKNIRYSGSVGLYTREWPEQKAPATVPYAGFAPFAEKGAARHNPLTSSGSEVQKLARIFGGKPFMAREATKEHLLMTAGKTTVLHLATHATENPDHPQLTELSFQGKNNNPEKLHYFEIGQQEWSILLVILGACGTTSGAYLPGYGTASLANIFQSAGVKSVVGANWSAGDAVSLKIISSFAENLKQGMSTGAALWEAKKEVLRQSDDLHSHPYYWAVYTHQGTEQYIELQEKEPKVNSWIFWIIGAGLLLIICVLSLVILSLYKRFS